jgi:hypothetical protein
LAHVEKLDIRIEWDASMSRALVWFAIIHAMPLAITV